MGPRAGGPAGRLDGSEPLPCSGLQKLRPSGPAEGEGAGGQRLPWLEEARRPWRFTSPASPGRAPTPVPATTSDGRTLTSKQAQGLNAGLFPKESQLALSREEQVPQQLRGSLEEWRLKATEALGEQELHPHSAIRPSQ